MVGRAITNIIIKKLGERQRKKRRQDIYDELTRHDLSEDDMIELWPYVATAVDHGGSIILLAAAVLGTVPLAIILFGGFFAINEGSIGAIIVGLVIALIGGLILRFSSWRMYKQWRTTNELINDLKDNPMSVPQTEVYNWLVEKTDFKSGQAYPDEAPVTPQDVLDNFDGEEASV